VKEGSFLMQKKKKAEGLAGEGVGKRMKDR
jgi:hypothetical protein